MPNTLSNIRKPLSLTFNSEKENTISLRLTSFSSVIYILPVVLFSLLWNVSRFLELDTCYYMRNTTMEGNSVEVVNHHSFLFLAPHNFNLHCANAAYSDGDP